MLYRKLYGALFTDPSRMDYRGFIEDIKALNFIMDEETADAAIKAVLGIMSSSVMEDIARNLVNEVLRTTSTAWEVKNRDR